MSHFRAALLALVFVVAGTTLAFGGTLPAAEVPVPECAYPTGTISESKHLSYARCRFDRMEALSKNQHAPVPTATVTATATETVTVTASPTPAPTPEPTPAPAGYPDASNTGVPAGTTLATVNGNVTLSTAGQVYADRQVNGCILVTAPNVTIRRVKVVCENDWAAIYNESTGLVVEDTEIDCGPDGVGTTGLGPRSYTARRVNAHGCENIFWASADVLVADSYLHDPVPYDPATDPHTDSVQIPSGGSNIVLRHNTILGGYIDQSNFGNAAVTMGGGVSGIIVDNNVLAGGGYTLYCEQEDRGGDGTPQPRYTDNRFSTTYRSTVGGFGPAYDCADDIQSGNVYHETGQPLSLGD